MNRTAITNYEKNQSFNSIVKWLHSFRYRHAIDVVRSMHDGSRLRILDVGCAFAKLYQVLDGMFDIDYTGLDKQEPNLRNAEARYGGRDNFRVIHDSACNSEHFRERYDLITALETLEHIPEHDAVRVVENIRAAAPRVFIASVPVEIGPVILAKNFGSELMRYPRRDEYNWRETLWASVYQLDRLPPHGTGHKGFDWRWLAQTIRHNFGTLEIRRLPFRYLPMALSTSAFFVAKLPASDRQ